MHACKLVDEDQVEETRNAEEKKKIAEKKD